MIVSSAPVSRLWVVPNSRSLSRGPRNTTSCGPILATSVAASTCSAVRVTCSTGRRGRSRRIGPERRARRRVLGGASDHGPTRFEGETALVRSSRQRLRLRGGGRRGCAPAHGRPSGRVEDHVAIVAIYRVGVGLARARGLHRALVADHGGP